VSVIESCFSDSDYVMLLRNHMPASINVDELNRKPRCGEASVTRPYI